MIIELSIVAAILALFVGYGYAVFHFTSKYKVAQFKGDGTEAVNKKILEVIEERETIRKQYDELRQQHLSLSPAAPKPST